MTERKRELAKIKANQHAIKTSIFQLKARIPKFLIGFLVIMVLTTFFLESRVYSYFGNGMNFIKFGLGFFIVVSFIFLYISNVKIKRKEKELKVAIKKLYQLIKLDTND